MSEDKRALVIAGLKRMLRRVEAGGKLPEAYSLYYDCENIIADSIEEANRDFCEAEPDDGDEWGVCVPLQWRRVHSDCTGDEPEDYYTVSVDELIEQQPLDLRPRRTLADVVANPPEGWTIRPGLDTYIWKWSPGSTGPVWASLELDEDLDLCYPPRITAYTLRDEAAAHRAVADLLDLLAEVSDA